MWILVKPQTSLLELFSTYSTLGIIEELYFMDLVDRIIMLKDFKRSCSIIINVVMIRFALMIKLIILYHKRW